MVLSAHNISVGYRNGKLFTVVQSNISLELIEGELVTLIGPNGSGKSTLLKALSGINEPLSGEIVLDGKRLTDISTQERSRMIALVLTEKVMNNFLRVEDLVALGRYPYSGWTGRLSTADKAKVEEAITLCHLENLRYNTLDQLSDGERQRAMIAKAIAQDTPIVILDEPTAHLDLKTRVEVLLLLRTLAQKTRKSIIVATHELELAIDLADEVWLMPARMSFIKELPEELVLNGHLSKAFDSGQIRFDQDQGSFKVTHGAGKAIQVVGDGLRAEWTKRALIRKGFIISATADLVVQVNSYDWELSGNNYSTLRELLFKLLQTA